MNIYAAKNFIKSLYPDKQSQTVLDHECIWQVDLMFKDGQPLNEHHVEYRKVKFDIEGVDPLVLDINPHREIMTTQQVLNLLNRGTKNDNSVNV